MLRLAAAPALVEITKKWVYRGDNVLRKCDLQGRISSNLLK